MPARRPERDRRRIYLVALIPRLEMDLIPIPGPSAPPPGSSWFRVSQHSRWFDGHFDGEPILPGIAHLALALAALVRQSGRNRTLTALRDVRFSRPLRPGDEVEVLLSEGREPFAVRFEIRCQGQRATLGLLVFAQG